MAPRHSERALIRSAARHGRGDAPRLLSPSAFPRRARALSGVLGQLGPAIAQQVEQPVGPTADAVHDGVPVPLRHRWRGGRHRNHLFARPPFGGFNPLEA